MGCAEIRLFNWIEKRDFKQYFYLTKILFLGNTFLSSLIFQILKVHSEETWYFGKFSFSVSSEISTQSFQAKTHKHKNEHCLKRDTKANNILSKFWKFSTKLFIIQPKQKIQFATLRWKRSRTQKSFDTFLYFAKKDTIKIK